MFKKPASVAFKGEQRLRGKEAKRLRDAVASRLGGEAAALALLPSKAEVLVRKVGGGSSAQFIFVDGRCLFVQSDGRAELGDAELLPALPAFWLAAERSVQLLPCVLIQRPVAKFIFRGADVMAPGVHSLQLAAGDFGLAPAVGDLVSVCAVGNPSACAVGRLRVAAASLGLEGARGEAVDVLHYFGDALWEACGSPRPEGFVGDEVRATAPGAAAEATEPPAAAAAAAGGAVARPAGGDATSAPSPGDGAAPAASAPEPSAPEAQPEVEDEVEVQTPEAMTRALEECFLQAAKTRLKDKDLPISGNLFYAQHMRPCRRAGAHIDVKTSSFKKLGLFLLHCEELGWLALKRNSPEPVVTRIARDHPDLREWKPWPRAATAEAAELAGGAADAAGSGGSGAAPAASIKVEPVWRLTKLKPLLEAVSCDMPEDACFGREEMVDCLQRYADGRDLWQRSNRKRIGPDALLLGLLGNGDGVGGYPAASACHASYPLDGLADTLLAALPPCHRVTAPQGGAAGGVKRSVRPGKPPAVQVRTDTRRGHHVTLVHGLESYGVDLEALAACLQKALAASASVEEASATCQAGVMVQGFWDVAVVDWLGKVGIPQESIQHQAKKGQHQKKTKQASNIVKN